MNDSNSYRLGPNKIIAKFCQISFGFKRKNNEATDNLYCMLLKDFINLRFPNSLSEEESDLEFNLRKSVNMLSLLQRFQQMTGIIMDSRIYEYYTNNSLSLESYFNGIIH
jgi:hypothetical protein